MKQKEVFIKTFGCQMNIRDSEIMVQSLVAYGYIEGTNVGDADLIILNTCSIRAKAEQKVMSLLGYLRKAKKLSLILKFVLLAVLLNRKVKRLLPKWAMLTLS